LVPKQDKASKNLGKPTRSMQTNDQHACFKAYR
jgi:hypothetical protein